MTEKSKGLYLKVSSRLATSTAHRLTEPSPHLCKAGLSDDVALHHESASPSSVYQSCKPAADMILIIKFVEIPGNSCTFIHTRERYSVLFNIFLKALYPSVIKSTHELMSV